MNINKVLSKKNVIPLKKLNSMISFLEKQQDYSSEKCLIEVNIEKVMDYIDEHYFWCPNCISYFEAYDGYKQAIKYHGEYLCRNCLKTVLRL